ncbi:MAG: CHAT domain-containing protein [Bacteroidota bacterium]
MGDIIERCQELIRQNRLDDALALMLDSFQQSDDQILISTWITKFRKLSRDNMLGIISMSDSNVERGTVTYHMLEFLSQKESEETNKQVVLFIGASPTDKSSLEIEKEKKLIDNLLESHQGFRLEAKLSASRDDLQALCNKFKPKVIHFACHSNHVGLFLEKNDGSRSTEFYNFVDFVDFLKQHSRTVDCIILNSCESENIGEHISKSALIPTIICMNQEIHDSASLRFAEGFYREFGNNEPKNPNYKNAYLAGKQRLQGSEDAFTVEIIETELYQ